MFEIDYYALPDGTKPVQQFIDGLPIKMKAKAMRQISLLQEFGNELREPYSKQIDTGLFELRVKFASDITRIFYFFVVGDKIILTNGFIKKTAKTLKGEIELARKYKADYERRCLSE